MLNPPVSNVPLPEKIFFQAIRSAYRSKNVLRKSPPSLRQRERKKTIFLRKSPRSAFLQHVFGPVGRTDSLRKSFYMGKFEKGGFKIF